MKIYNTKRIEDLFDEKTVKELRGIVKRNQCHYNATMACAILHDFKVNYVEGYRDFNLPNCAIGHCINSVEIDGHVYYFDITTEKKGAFLVVFSEEGQKHLSKVLKQGFSSLEVVEQFAINDENYRQWSDSERQCMDEITAIREKYDKIISRYKKEIAEAHKRHFNRMNAIQ